MRKPLTIIFRTVPDSPHLNGIIKHLGPLAIPHLKNRYLNDSGKGRKTALEKLKLLGEPGAKAITELEAE